ncbi:hypothetical protein DFH06DRAFT_1343927 [Mycena polygramma]|nr:hypothetical protein DFH06DRAFT_1343927 [Mycena polygramma]
MALFVFHGFAAACRPAPAPPAPLPPLPLAASWDAPATPATQPALRTAAVSLFAPSAPFLAAARRRTPPSSALDVSLSALCLGITTGPTRRSVNACCALHSCFSRLPAPLRAAPHAFISWG